MLKVQMKKKSIRLLQTCDELHFLAEHYFLFLPAKNAWLSSFPEIKSYEQQIIIHF